MNDLWTERLFFVGIGFLLGVVVTWILVDAIARWKRGWGLLQVPEKTRVRHDQEWTDAKNRRSQGCRELVRSIGCFIFAALVVFAAAVLLRAFIQQFG